MSPFLFEAGHSPGHQHSTSRNRGPLGNRTGEFLTSVDGYVRSSLTSIEDQIANSGAKIPLLPHNFMVSTVLITGGAGFIGSHLTDRLLAQGHRVRILDTLVPQVHGSSARRPSYLSREAEFIQGDIRDPNAVQRAVKDVSGVFHLAATVGVGQSMYQIHRYSDVNAWGQRCSWKLWPTIP